jgi:hypothetical protein
MKLHITRNQAGRFLGGINFELSVQVELTKEEDDLVSKYQAYGEVLLKKKIWTGGEETLTIGSLTNGQKFKGANIAEILAYEDAVKDGCKTFKTYLEVMRSFGGTEVIEYAVVDGAIKAQRAK